MAESEGFEPPLGCPKPDFELAGLRLQNKRLRGIASANDIRSPRILALAFDENREIAERSCTQRDTHGRAVQTAKSWIRAEKNMVAT
jgi:hypothetical protein